VFGSAVVVVAFAEWVLGTMRWPRNGFLGLVWTVAVAYKNAVALLLAFTLPARLESTLSSPHHLPDPNK